MLCNLTRLFLTGLLLLASLSALTGCAKDIPLYVPPEQRPVARQDAPWPDNHFIALAYHEVEDDDPDQAYLSVRTAMRASACTGG